MEKAKKIKNIISLLLVVVLLFCQSTTIILAIEYPAGNSVHEKITNRLIDFWSEQSPQDNVSVIICFEDGVNHDEIEQLAIESLNYSPSEFNKSINDELLSSEEIQDYIMQKRMLSSSYYNDYNADLANGLLSEDEILYISNYSPIIIANINMERALEIASNQLVICIDLYYDDNEIEITTANKVTRATYALSTFGYYGNGIKIGILEVNIPNASSFPSLNIVNSNGSTGSDSNHGNMVLEIVSSIAPNADYYLADTTSQSSIEAIEWLLGQGVNVINASRTIGSDSYNTYGTMSQWLDHIAYYHDVHFVKSSGNKSGSGVTSGGMAYNIITVGNLNDNRTESYNDDIINSNSSFYNGNTLAYKPEICCPGTGISTSFSPTTSSGTSLSAPQVTGTIAILCQQRPALKTRQDTMKALLTASVNFTSSHRYVPSDEAYRRYGAGILDVYGASWVASNVRYVMSSISNNTTSNNHYFTVTAYDTKIRVSLAFVKHSWLGPYDNHEEDNPVLVSLSNLDLKVYAPGSTTPIKTSTRVGTNVEIVEFTPTITGTYRIEVVNTSSLETTYYGLSWR